ncbi:hypothetical protein [Halosegnis longus]|uniref:hypothetical protein n=1 Tax=Halosegnis longus TaxID=2216012 RepID=UPI00129EE80D|nr:hypothetical protein [Halosegnis longus]
MTQHTSITSRITRHTSLSRLRAVALAGVVVDVTLTRTVVGTAQATEIGPLSRTLIETGGYPLWAAVFLAFVAGASEVATRLVADEHRVNQHVGWGMASLLALGPWVVTAANVGGVLTVGGWPETAPWGEIATVGLFTLGGATVAFAPRELVGQVRRRSPSGRSVAIVAMTAFVVVGGVPLGTMSPTGQSEASVATADSDFTQDFESTPTGELPAGWSTPYYGEVVMQDGKKVLTGRARHSATGTTADFTLEGTVIRSETKDQYVNPGGFEVGDPDGGDLLAVNLNTADEAIDIVVDKNGVTNEYPIQGVTTQPGTFDFRIAGNNNQIEVTVEGNGETYEKTISQPDIPIPDVAAVGKSEYYVDDVSYTAEYIPETTTGTVETSDGSPVPGAPLVQNGNVLGYTDAQGNYELAASGQVTVYSSRADGPATGTIGDTITMEPAKYDNKHDSLNIHYWKVDETDENGEPLGWDIYGAPGTKLDFEVISGPQEGETWTRYADKDLDGNYTSNARFQAPPSGILKITSTYNGVTQDWFVRLKPGGRLMGIRLGNPKEVVSWEDDPPEQLNETNVVRPGDRGGEVVTGTVTNQAGTPVSNATVEVVSVEQQAVEDQLNQTLSEAPTQEDIQQRVDELVGDSIPDIPSAFQTQQSDGFQLTGANAKPSEFDGEYPLVYTREDISANSGFSYFDTAQLSEPAWRDIDAGQQVMLTAVDPTDGRNSGFLNGEYDSQVFGTFENDAAVVVEPLVGEDATSRTTVTLDQRQGGGLGDPSALNYGTVALSDGFYRVSVVDSDISYVIKVGNPIQLLSEEIRADVRDSVEDSVDSTEQRLTDASQQAKNAFDSGAFQRITSSTDADGEFRAVLDNRTETVIVQAYKYPDGQYAFNRTQTGLQNAVSGEDAPAVYFPTRPRRASVPAENLDITMTEVSTNPFGNATAYQDQFEAYLNELKNETFSDLPQALQEGLDGTSREKLEEIATQFEGLRNNNEQLMDLYRENLDQQVDADEVAEELDLDQLSNEELKSQVQAMQQSLTEVQSTVEVLQESGDTVQEDGQNLLSRTWSIGNTGVFSDSVGSDALSVRVTPSDGGETEILSTDSDYLSVTNGPTGTTVALEDYPLGEMDVAQVQLDVATPSGLGTSTSTVTNPAFTANIPELDSMSFSTLSPGPSELVTGEVVPADRTAFGGLDSVTITKPDGSTITPTLDGREFEFSTSGAGAYRIETTFSNSAGNQFTEVQYLDAASSDEQDVPRVRTVSGPTGTYALTGGIDSARVESNAGTETTITAVIGENAEIPGSLHVYTSGLELAPSADVTVAVVRAPDERALERRVNVVLHTPAPGDDAIFRVNGAAVPPGAENSLATLDVRSDGTTADTLTNANGVVTLSTTANPSFWESIVWDFDNLRQDLPLIHIGGFSLGGLIPLSLRRRRNGGESA